MPFYMAQFAYTADAIKTLTRSPEDRTETVKGLVEKLGGRFHGLYYSLGEYDGFVLYEAPDDITASAFILAANTPGHLKATRITALLTPQEAVEAMRKAGGQSYKGPAGG